MELKKHAHNWSWSRNSALQGSWNKKRCAQSELRTNGERTTRGFTVLTCFLVMNRYRKKPISKTKDDRNKWYNYFTLQKPLATTKDDRNNWYSYFTLSQLRICNLITSPSKSGWFFWKVIWMYWIFRNLCRTFFMQQLFVIV